MNLYEKIQAVRIDLANTKITMTGDNKFAGYKYFELNDFIKPLNELMRKYKMTAIATFDTCTASLTAIDCEKPEDTYTITSPFGSASLKGCHEVQNIGAVETYQRRYLYQAMFDIAESDGLNATQGKDENKGDENKGDENKGNAKATKQPVFPTKEDNPKDKSSEREMSLTEANSVKVTTRGGGTVYVSSLTDEQLDLLLANKSDNLTLQRSAAKAIKAERQSKK